MVEFETEEEKNVLSRNMLNLALEILKSRWYAPSTEVRF